MTINTNKEMPILKKQLITNSQDDIIFLYWWMCHLHQPHRQFKISGCATFTSSTFPTYSSHFDQDLCVSVIDFFAHVAQWGGGLPIEFRQRGDFKTRGCDIMGKGDRWRNRF